MVDDEASVMLVEEEICEVVLAEEKADEDVPTGGGWT